MTKPQLEHVNFTVREPDVIAQTLCRIFGWHIRWQGPALNDGYTVHVGNDDQYLALYAPKADLSDIENTYEINNGLNHIAIRVDDLDAIEFKVKGEGLKPQSHADYEPGKRFYFYLDTGLEIEVVSYNT